MIAANVEARATQRARMSTSSQGRLTAVLPVTVEAGNDGQAVEVQLNVVAFGDLAAKVFGLEIRPGDQIAAVGRLVAKEGEGPRGKFQAWSLVARGVDRLKARG